MRVQPGWRALALLGGILGVTGLAVEVLLVSERALLWTLVGAFTAVLALLGHRTQVLSRTNADLRHRTRDAEEANEAKSRFLANMSHELRTPLNGIMGFAELLHDGRLGAVSAEQSEGLADILTSSRHLLALVNDILDLSRIESGRLTFAPELIDPRAIARECVDSLRSVAAAEGVEVALAAPDGTAAVLLDPAKLRQVVFNYVSNAIKFTPAGGDVCVRVTLEDALLRLEVSDTGPGIAPRDHERVFFEFEQLHGGLARGQAGTGLGLAVTKRIVEAQGGHVGVESDLGAGSTFYAELPIGARPVVPRAEIRRLPDGVAVRVQEAAA